MLSIHRMNIKAIFTTFRDAPVHIGSFFTGQIRYCRNIYKISKMKLFLLRVYIFAMLTTLRGLAPSLAAGVIMIFL